jgi:H+/Cl- antiporter ClcA
MNLTLYAILDFSSHRGPELNWRRGLLRLWVVASIAWAIGTTIWLLYRGAETAQLLAGRCDTLTDTANWADCFRNAQAPAEGDTWFWSGLRSGNWMLIVVPPTLLLFFGAVVVRTCTWVARGFSSDRSATRNG